MFYQPTQRFLVLDIETVPSADPALIDALRQKLAPPATYKKPESIAEWHRTQGAESLQEKIAGTALKGTQGDVCAIGWQTFELSKGPDHASSRRSIFVRGPGQGPRDFLSDCFAAMGRDCSGARHVVAGHNINQFDLPFLWQQTLRYREPRTGSPAWPAHLFPMFPGGYGRGQFIDVLDTMTAIVGHRNTISLRDAALSFGIPWDENIPSAEVPTAWLDNDLSLVEEHLLNDVTVTARLAHRIASVALSPDVDPFESGDNR